MKHINTNASEYVAKLKDLSFERYNMLLYTKDTVLLAINILQNNGIQLYGFDSFIIKDESIQPFLEFSPDYSNIKSREDIYIIAKQDVIKAYSNNSEFVFELVYERY